MQRKDFVGIFKALKGRPCTVRLLDPPLHEFLPHDAAGQKEMAETMGVPVKEISPYSSEYNPPVCGYYARVFAGCANPLNNIAGQLSRPAGKI